MARAWADSQREMLRRGVDPLVIAEQEAAAQREALEAGKREADVRAATLHVVATAYHASITATFRNRKHHAQWLPSLEGCLPAALLAKPIGDIGPSEVAQRVAPAARPRTGDGAARAQRLDAVFADAVLRNLCTGNPAAAIVRRMRVKRQGEQPHLRALHYRDVPGLVVALRSTTRIGMSVKLAIELAILTASRSGEVRGARWGEVDRKAKLWVVPAARIKGHEAHRVHLSPRALEIVAQAATLRTDMSDAALVFPAPRDGTRPLADMTLTMALRRLQRAARATTASRRRSPT